MMLQKRWKNNFCSSIWNISNSYYNTKCSSSLALRYKLQRIGNFSTTMHESLFSLLLAFVKVGVQDSSCFFIKVARTCVIDHKNTVAAHCQVNNSHCLTRPLLKVSKNLISVVQFVSGNIILFLMMNAHHLSFAIQVVLLI